MNVDFNTCHRALLKLAEEFRTKSPPDHRSCLQCLIASLSFPVANAVVAKTNYQIGSILYKKTNNTNVAQIYLERSYELCQTPDLISIRLEVAALLIEIHLNQSNLPVAKQLLSTAISDSSSAGSFLNWHFKSLLQLSQLNLDERDFQAANYLLTLGAEAAGATNDLFTRILFLLSKGMVLMIARKYQGQTRNQQNVLPQQQVPNNDQQLVDTLALAGELLESWQDNSGDVYRKEALKVFFLVLQVCHHLNAGHVKQAKPCLRLLQQSMQNVTNAQDDTNGLANHSEKFIWMSKDLMCVLVYLITVIHSMQAGILEKAQRYTERALLQIERLKVTEPEPLLETFQLILLEHVSMCHLVIGQKSTAIKEIAQALQLCYNNPRFRIRHKGNIHALLGEYAMSMSQIDDAINQFNRVINDPNVNTELRVMAMLNLALCYIQTRRERELEELLTRLNPGDFNSVTNESLKAASYFVHAYNAFAHSRYNDAKTGLREALKMTVGEDLNRLTACSLVLLGNIFKNLGRQHESFNMMSSGIALANKIPDIHVQLWASSIMKDIYASVGDQQRQQEAYNSHQNFSQRIYHEQYQASSLHEHHYIQWLGDS